MWQMHQRTMSVLGALLTVLVGLLLADPAMAGAATGCRVVDTRDGAVHHRLQRAINHAVSGDTLLVRGTCVGSFSVIDKNLTLRGVPSDGSARATLDGGGAGSVLFLAGGSQVLENLVVQNGFAHQGARIENDGSIVTLKHTIVRDNRAERSGIGGGIDDDGFVILEHSRVRRNVAGLGGGIYANLGLIVLRHSTVKHNRAEGGAGGGIFSDFGEVQLTDSSMSGNRARFSAGGLDIDGGFLLVAGSTTITGNTLTDTSHPGAGGLGAFGDSSAKSADGTSAFVDRITGATLPAWTGSVSGNVPTDCCNGCGIFTIACG